MTQKKKQSKKAKEKYLQSLYYDVTSAGSFGGLDRLHRQVRRDDEYNISKSFVREWLSSQDAYTLHRPIRKRWKRNRVYVASMDEQWEIDLVDMSNISRANDSFRYLLTIIDVLSKYAFAVPLKTKTGREVLTAFDSCVTESGRQPIQVHSDEGMEFLNHTFQQYLKDKDIHHFTTGNKEIKAAVVERFNRTLRSRMYRYFTANYTKRYIDVLPELLEGYNNSYHRSIKMTPSSVTRKNEDVAWHNLYTPKGEGQKMTFHFQVGDQVRITKAKKKFEQGYLPNWTEEVFRIGFRIPRSPPVYKLRDAMGEPLMGTFYEKELQKVKISKDSLYRVEKIMEEKTVGRKKWMLVKWKGYPSKFNSWVAASDFKKAV